MDLTSFTSIILILFLTIGTYIVFTNQVEGRSKMILIVALLIIFIVIFINLPMFKSYSELLTSPTDATKPYSISSSQYTVSSTSYSISTWIYIQDWNTNYGIVKTILDRASNPTISLSETSNDLIIAFQTGNPSLTPNSHTITIDNISIQKWVNITVCFGDNNVDTYINGKLVNTYVISEPQHISPSETPSPISITQNGGFSGSISNLRYYNSFLTPQQVWDIYNAGFGSNMLSNFLNQYNASFTFYQNQNVKAQFYLM